MGAKKQRVWMPGRYEECILHVAGRMIRREIQRFEYVIVVFYLRTFRYVITEFAEYVHNLLSDD